MKWKLAALFAIPFLAGLPLATDKYFRDIESVSVDGVWRVTAVSPDNHRSGFHPWQKDFVYSAFQKGGKEPVWTREQAKQDPSEDSPKRVVVANDGWVAIHTSWDALVFVDPAGQNRGHVEDLKTLLEKANRKSHAVESTAGLIWDPYSFWYFLPESDRQLLVVRLWWGERLFVDPENGLAVPESEELKKRAEKHEADSAIVMLSRYRTDPMPEPDQEPIMIGAFLAGVLREKDAIPLLWKLQESEYVGLEGGRVGQKPELDINPLIFSCRTARQLSKLMLRRLGGETSTLPIYDFASAQEDDGFFCPEPIDEPVENRFPSVRPGMTAREVLTLVGSPDFVLNSQWEFDVSGPSESTLIIEWQNGRVSNTEKTSPKWKEELTRERFVVLF